LGFRWYFLHITVRHRPLLGTGTQGQHSALGKSLLRRRGPRFDWRLRQMQRSRHQACAFPFLTHRLPVLLQRSPDGFPILRLRFYDHCLDLLFEQPFGQQSQLFGAAAKQLQLKLVFAFDFNVRDNHRQYPLMDIDSRYPIGQLQ
jgi:hypothetical protein